MRLTDNPVFATLQDHAASLSDISLKDRLDDSERQKALSLSVDDLHIDLSRHNMTSQKWLKQLICQGNLPSSLTVTS